MIEQGSVVKVEGRRARVLTQRSQACESCGSKSICHSLGGDQKTSEVEAVNTANAKVGDIVSIELKSSSVLKSAFLVYLVPVVFLFIGIITGNKISVFFNFNKDTVSIVSGLTLFIISFLLIKLASNRLAKKNDFIPEITKILKSE